MSELTPQDLNSSLSVLNFLREKAIETSNSGMNSIVTELLNQYNNVIEEPDKSDLTLLPYNRKDAYSILEYLKLQAEQLSEGKWTDFSDGDIGTVFLKLLSYLADMNNYQTDKVVSELYLSTMTERASAISLSSLIGYEPRHYQSAYTDVTFVNLSNANPLPDGTIIPKFTVVTDYTSSIAYCSLEESAFYDNECKVRMYEGSPITKTFDISNIDTLGRIFLSDYNIGTNTISLNIDGKEYNKVDDVRFINGNLGFSVHVTTDKSLYIQLPSYWSDIVTQSSIITISYLLTNGENGRVGKNILIGINQLNSNYRNYITILSNTASIGGYNPESVDEMKTTIPRHTRTMDTIVTINDFEEVGMNVLGISDISALDYNDPSSGLVQPDDYYKVHLYVLPEADTYNATDLDLVKYRNTIIKDRVDWNLEDLSKVSDDLETYSQSSITGATITLTDAGKLYTVDDIIPVIYTGDEDSSYLVELVSNPTTITDRVVCSITKSSNNIVVNFNSNWKSLLNANDRVYIYFKQDQVLTEKGQALREYIDQRRLASLNVTYHNLDIVQPTIKVDLYMDKNNTKFNTISTAVKDFIVDKYSRKNLKIGEPIFGSVIGSDILTQFKDIRYCEVREPEELIEVLPRGFIDVVPNVYDFTKGTIVDKVIVNVYDYQNKKI